jgi:hypothetical protein
MDWLSPNPATGARGSKPRPWSRTVTGGIQLGLWVLSWILAFFLIGFFLWIGVAIWSAIDGHQAAKLWNRRHGFIT